MKSAELYKGISPEKQGEYEAWLIDRYGDDMPERIQRSRKKYEALTEPEKQELQEELRDVEQSLAEALRRGVPMGSTSLDPLLQRHREWVGYMWDRPCPPEAYSGLADLYLGHPDFVSRYESIESGFAQYLAGSMRAFAARLPK